jgi:hypothetical protein
VLLNYIRAGERWLRAEFLRELWREDEALRVYASFPDPHGYDLIYLAPSHPRRADLHERWGERARAAEHYERFLGLWRDAGAELQPLVRGARERLRLLSGTAGAGR